MGYHNTYLCIHQPYHHGRSSGKWPIELFSKLLPRVYQIIEEINRRFILEIQNKYPGNQEKIRKMAIIYDGQVKMAHLAIAGGYSVNGVARLHTEILENRS